MHIETLWSSASLCQAWSIADNKICKQLKRLTILYQFKSLLHTVLGCETAAQFTVHTENCFSTPRYA